MQIILTQDVSKLGRRGDVKEVKPGYFQNFLFPRNLAIVATKPRLKEAEKRRELRLVEKEQVKNEAAKIVKKLEGLKLLFTKKVTSKDKLYGSIGEKDIIAAVEKKAKIQLDKENILLKEPIKTAGEHEIPIKLTDEVQTTITLEIKPEKK